MAWVRGTNSMEGNAPESLPRQDDPLVWLDGSLLLKTALHRLGWVFQAHKTTPEQRTPMFALSRNCNAFRFSGFTPDTTVALALRTPLGAPIFNRGEVFLKAGLTVLHPPKAWEEECRIFLEQQADGIISCRRWVPGTHGIDRRFMITGLDQATVRFFPVPDTAGHVTFLANPEHPFSQGDFRRASLQNSGTGPFFELHEVTGNLLISW